MEAEWLMPSLMRKKEKVTTDIAYLVGIKIPRDTFMGFFNILAGLTLSLKCRSNLNFFFYKGWVQ